MTSKVTVHVAIFTVHLDGLREIYRQFLRLPDGAIIEVYDISTGKSQTSECKVISDNLSRMGNISIFSCTTS